MKNSDKFTLLKRDPVGYTGKAWFFAYCNGQPVRNSKGRHVAFAAINSAAALTQLLQQSQLVQS